MGKNSAHLVDSELLSFVGDFPDVELTDAMLPAIQQARLPPAEKVSSDDGVERLDGIARGREGAPDIPLVILRSRRGRECQVPCIYHIHGGGFLTGNAEVSAAFHRPLVEELGCALVSVNYRLAPETPFPGPLNDCYDGLAWLFANAVDLGIDPARIGLMGESAGGGLAAALALMARDIGDYRLSFQHLVAPMLDDRTCVSSDPNPFAGEYVWPRVNNCFGWRCYLGAEPGSSDVSPYAAPARMDNLTGLPPAYVSTGALDLFADENIDYARRLIRAGVPTEFHIYPGAVHGFALADAAVARRAASDQRDALARTLAG